MYKITCDRYTLLDVRDESFIVKIPKVKLSDNTAGGATFTIYEQHPNYDKLAMLKSVFEISDEYGVIFRGRMTENTRDIHKGKAVDLEGAMAFFNDSIVRPYTFPDDWEKEDHPDHAAYMSAAENGNVVEFYLAWLIHQHNEQVADFQQFKLGTVTVTDPNNTIERANSEYPNTWEELEAKLFKSSLAGHLCIRYEADGNYIDYLAEFTETNEQGITYGKNLRDISQTSNGKETYSAIIPRGAEAKNTVDTGDDYEGIYGTITGSASVSKKLTIEDLPDGNITDDIVKKGDMLYSKTAVAAFGWRFVPSSESTWEDVTDAKNLQSRGVDVLEGTVTNIPNTIEVKAVDLHCTDSQIRSFRMYKKIPVHVAPHDINTDFDINTLDLDLLNPQNTNIVAGKTVMTMTDLQEKQAKEIKNLLGSLVTKTQLEAGYKATESLIEKSSDSILLKVSETYATQASLSGYVTTSELSATSNSILASVSGSYATKDELNTVSGQLELKIGKDENDRIVSMLNASADIININANRLVINSTKFKLTAEGEITAMSGYIGDWELTNGFLRATANTTFQGYEAVQVTKLTALGVEVRVFATGYNEDGQAEFDPIKYDYTWRQIAKAVAEVYAHW